MSEPIHDLAHIGHAELLTPFPDQSLAFFTELFGMEIEAREGESVYLRGLGRLPALRPQADRVRAARARPHRDPRLESAGARAARRRDRGAPGSGSAGSTATSATDPAYRFTDPDGHLFELYYESERYEPPDHLRPALKNVPQRYVGRGAAVKRFDHVNVLCKDVGGQPPLRRRSSSGSASTSRSCSTTAPSRAPG